MKIKKIQTLKNEQHQSLENLDYFISSPKEPN